ncbi:hypothetical protein KIPB_003010, partial [Kipferlia bialata]
TQPEVEYIPTPKQAPSLWDAVASMAMPGDPTSKAAQEISALMDELGKSGFMTGKTPSPESIRSVTKRALTTMEKNPKDSYVASMSCGLIELVSEMGVLSDGFAAVAVSKKQAKALLSQMGMKGQTPLVVYSVLHTIKALIEDEMNCGLLVSCGLVKGTLAALNACREDSKCVAVACCLITTMANKDITIGTTVLETKGLPAIVSGLSTHLGSASVANEVFQTLMTLAAVEGGGSALYDLKVDELAIQAMERHKDNKKLVISGLNVIRNMSSVARTVKTGILNSAGAYTIVRTIKNLIGDAEVVANGLAAIHQLTYVIGPSLAQCQGRAIELRVHTLIVKALTKHSRSTMVIDSSISLLNSCINKTTQPLLEKARVTPLVVKALGVVSLREEVVLCLNCLSNLGLHSPGCRVLVFDRAYTPALAAMEKYGADAEVQKNAAYVLALTLGHVGDARTLRQACIALLKTGQRHMKNLELLEMVGKALAKLCSSAAGMQVLGDVKAHETVLQMLNKNPDDRSIVLSCLTVLTNMSLPTSNAPSATQVLLCKAGAVQAAIRCLKTYWEDVSVVRQSLALLMNITGSDENEEMMLKLKVHVHASNALKKYTSDDKVAASAVAVIKNLSATTTERGVLVQKGGAFSGLKACMEGHSKDPITLDIVLACIVNMTVAVGNHIPLLNSGLAQLVLKAMTDYPHNEPIAISGCWLLANTCSGDQTAIARCIDLGVVKQLMATLKDHPGSAVIVYRVFSALQNIGLLSGTVPKIHAVLLAADVHIHAVSAMQRFMKVVDPLTNAAQVITCMCQSDRLGEPVIKAAVEAGVLPLACQAIELHKRNFHTWGACGNILTIAARTECTQLPFLETNCHTVLSSLLVEPAFRPFCIQSYKGLLSAAMSIDTKESQKRGIRWDKMFGYLLKWMPRDDADAAFTVLSVFNMHYMEMEPATIATFYTLAVDCARQFHVKYPMMVANIANVFFAQSADFPMGKEFQEAVVKSLDVMDSRLAEDILLVVSGVVERGSLTKKQQQKCHNESILALQRYTDQPKLYVIVSRILHHMHIRDKVKLSVTKAQVDTLTDTVMKMEHSSFSVNLASVVVLLSQRLGIECNIGVIRVERGEAAQPEPVTTPKPQYPVEEPPEVVVQTLEEAEVEVPVDTESVVTPHLKGAEEETPVGRGWGLPAKGPKATTQEASPMAAGFGAAPTAPSAAFQFSPPPNGEKKTSGPEETQREEEPGAPGTPAVPPVAPAPVSLPSPPTREPEVTLESPLDTTVTCGDMEVESDSEAEYEDAKSVPPPAVTTEAQELPGKQSLPTEGDRPPASLVDTVIPPHTAPLDPQTQTPTPQRAPITQDYRSEIAVRALQSHPGCPYVAALAAEAFMGERQIGPLLGYVPVEQVLNLLAEGLAHTDPGAVQTSITRCIEHIKGSVVSVSDSEPSVLAEHICTLLSQEVVSSDTFLWVTEAVLSRAVDDSNVRALFVDAGIHLAIAKHEVSLAITKDAEASGYRDTQRTLVTQWLRALYCLVESDEARLQLVNTGRYSVAVDVLSEYPLEESSLELHTVAVQLLDCLSDVPLDGEEPSTLLKSVQEPGCVESLCKCLAAYPHSEDIVDSALGVLSQIVEEGEASVLQSVFAADGCTATLSALAAHPEAEGLQLSGLSVVSALCNGDTPMVTTLLEQHVAEGILNVLESHTGNAEIALLCIAALTGLVQVGDPALSSLLKASTQLRAVKKRHARHRGVQRSLKALATKM